MTRSEFVASVAEKTNMTKKDVDAVVKAYHDTVTETLKAGDKISFVGFGTYETSERAARTGRNPQTGEEMTIAASKVAKFKAGKALKDAINA